ncbi:MAG TPA: LysR family transcriptional regulator [Steroidobacteraceae bacterium]|nr:LysR family transcriptional regulator [Steroidobacteraceae bacterium]
MSVSQVAGVLTDLHLLTVIAQTRSLTQAARRLGISKASVSTRLRDLERAIGMSLVRRTTRSVTLTPAALQLVDDTQASFTRIEQSFDQAKDLAGKPRGLLRITAPVALGRQRIAPSVPDFLRRFPEIRLELDLNDRFVNVAQEGFDLAVRHARSIPDTYIARVLCESRSLLLASPEYLQRRGIPEHPTDLARHDCLLYLRDGSAQNWSFEKVAARKRVERGELVSVPVGGPFKANNSEVLRAAIIGGLGIGLLPDFSASAQLDSGAMQPLLTQWRPVGFFGERIYAIRPGGVRASRAVECAIEHLRQVFGQQNA